MITMKLSNRELEVLDKISLGLTTKEIASTLFVSYHTVVSHRQNLMEKLNVRNTAGLVRRAFETGYLQLPIQSKQFQQLL